MANLFKKFVLGFEFDEIFDWLTPDAPKQTIQGVNVTLGEPTFEPMVYGAVNNVEGILVRSLIANPDDNDDVPNDIIWLQVIWSVGQIEEIGQIYLDDIPIDSPAYDGDNSTTSRWAHHWNSKDGATISFAATTYQPQLTFTGEGYAFSIIRLEYDPEKMNRFPKITADLKGIKVSPVEGGAKVYSTNYSDILNDYLTNTDYGRDLSNIRINAERMQIEKTFSGEMLAPYEGGALQPLMSCNARLNGNDTILDNTKKILKGCRGSLPYIQGQFHFYIERERDASDTLTSSDRMSDLVIEDNEVKDRFNRVTVRFPDRSQTGKVTSVTYPVEDSEYQIYLAEDFNKKLEKNVTLDTVDNIYEALQQAEIILKRSRNALKAKISSKSRLKGLGVGMVMNLEDEAFGLVAKPFIITAKKTKSNGIIEWELLEYQASIYPWNTKAEQIIPDTNVSNYWDVNAPVNLAVTFPDDGTAQAVVTWESQHKSFLVSVNGDNYQTISAKEFKLNNIVQGSLTIKIKAINGLGYRSANATLSFIIEAPQTPTLNIIAGVLDAVVTPSITGSTLGVTFELMLGLTNVFDDATSKGFGSSFTLLGLGSEIEHFVWARSINVAGTSEWASSSFTTTNADAISLLISNLDQSQLNESTQDLIAQLDRNTASNLPDRIELIGNDLSREVTARKSLDRAVFDVTANYSSWRNEYERRTLNGENLIDAAVYVDPETGVIVNRAFAYTDESFTAAGVLINGVDGRVTLEAERITASEERIVAAEASIVVNAGQILQRATYTEVTSEIAGAISALTPAYSWQFNANVEAFTGQSSWNALGYIVSNSDVITSPVITFDAAENPVFRIRVRKHVAGTWIGDITGGGVTIPLPEPTAENVWEVIQIDTTGTTGYSGDITALVFNLGDCDIDYIEVGKRGANDQAFEDISARTSTIEQDINAGTGSMSAYATTTWINSLGYQTESNVDTLIDTFNTTYSITATLEEFDNNDTLLKANSASTWVDGAESNITNVVESYNAQDGGVNEQLTTAGTEIDGLKGTIKNQVTSINGLNLNVRNAGLSSVMNAYTEFLLSNEIKVEGVKLANAETRLEATATELEATAIQTTELIAITENTQAELTTTNKVIANEKQSTAESINNLNVSMGEGDSATLSSANEYTRASVGYCVDADGNITGESDAVVCAAVTGNSWIEGALAEFIRNLQISNGTNTASLTDIRQVFEDLEGKLVARGGMVTDVNGRINGYVSTNDGEIGSFDIIADIQRSGVMIDGVYVPLLYLDQTNPADVQMVLKGRLELGDGKIIKELADIEAEDGTATSVEMLYSTTSLVTDDSLWHYPMVNGDVYVKQRIKTQKGDQDATYSDWSVPAEIKGQQGLKGDNPLVTKSGGTVTITDGDGNTVTVTDGEDAALPTVTDNGDGTYTVTDGAGNSVVVSDGHDPVLGSDYFDGISGDYHSVRYQAKTSIPAKPTNGSFDGTTETPPTDTAWVDDFYAESGKTTYRTERVYAQSITYSNGSATVTWTGSVWSAPEPYGNEGVKGNPADPVWYKWDGTSLLIKVQATQPVGYTQDSGAAIELKGDNGVTTYTWIKYADDASGTNITNTAGTKEYIGFAYNKTTATESNVAADYSWSQIKGAEGDNGDSAYQIWLAEGNTGTEADFIEYLNGSDGVNGNTWYSGTSNPSNSLGVVGDFYLKAGRYVYEKTAATTWTYTEDLKGIQGDSVKGDTGNRGAARYEVGTTSGLWSDATAANATPSNSPVVDDVVTIYKSTDLTQAPVTKFYNGSAWNTFDLRIHGSVMIDDTLNGDVLIAGTRIRSPKIEFVGTTHMRISSATGFGSTGQFIEWFGVKILLNGLVDYASLTKANAITYLTVDGDAYFGGAIISGTLQTSKATSEISTTASVDIEIGSNGGLIAVNYSINLNSLYSSDLDTATMPTPPVPSCVVVFEKFVGASWEVQSTHSLTGTSGVSRSFYDGESGKWINDGYQSLIEGFTFMDSSYTTTNKQYRLRFLSISNLNSLGYWSMSQRLSLTSSEG